jgi:hypothetical protein
MHEIVTFTLGALSLKYQKCWSQMNPLPIELIQWILTQLSVEKFSALVEKYLKISYLTSAPILLGLKSFMLNNLEATSNILKNWSINQIELSSLYTYIDKKNNN